MPSPSLDVNSPLHAQFIRAGAGAGKTTRLIQTFSEFVHAFQAKHARFPRIVITTFTRKATQEVKERLLVHALKNNEKDIFEAINKKSLTQISTIHGLLSLYLGKNAHHLSLPQELKIVDQVQAKRALKKTMHSILKKKSSYVELLDAYSFNKLVEVTALALELLAQNKNFKFADIQILRQTTEQKIKMVDLKLTEILSSVNPVPEKWVEYFRFLSNYQKILKTENISEAIHFFENEVKKPIFTTKNPAFPAHVHDLIDEVRKSDLFVDQDTEAYQRLHEQLNQLFYKFLIEVSHLDFENKKRSGELTISDLENFSLRLIESFPETAQEFSKSWDYFMIDEYQDTSPLQVKILNALVQDRPCFIVGDPQQSIYLFRGARSEVFNAKELEFKEKNIEIQFLNTNYRSEPALMHFINDFFSSFSNQFKAMQPKEKFLDLPQAPQAYFIKSHDQTLAALEQIQNLLASGAQPKDICVLSRKNSSLTQVARSAYAFQIPVQLQAAGGFEFKREVLDLISFLKFLVNPHDNENLITLLRSPWFYVDDHSLVTLAHSDLARAQSLWSAVNQSENKIKSELLNYLNEYALIGAHAVLNKMILKTGFLNLSELLDPTGKREANIWKLMTALVSAEKKSGFSLSQFIEDQFQSLQSDLGSSAGEAQPVIQPDRVSLMTVHAAKGLQFKHVIILGFSDKPLQTNVMNLAFDAKTQLFSLAVYSDAESKHLASAWSTQVRKNFNERELSENERVLYVAMTRAEQSISLIAELPEEGQKKIIVNSSWYKKTKWHDQDSENENYKVAGRFFKQALSLQDKKSILPSVVRAKRNSGQALPTTNESVTELLSSEKKSSKSQFDRQIQFLKKAQKGTDLHKLFEALKYKKIEDLLNEVDPDEKIMLQYLLQQKDIRLLDVLDKGFNEWGFGLKNTKGRIQGQIDAWAELENEIHVLDYKTGSPAYVDKAFRQLSIYTYALIKMNKISLDKKIVHSVLYPTDQKILQRVYAHAEAFRSKEPALGELFIT